MIIDLNNLRDQLVKSKAVLMSRLHGEMSEIEAANFLLIYRDLNETISAIDTIENYIAVDLTLKGSPNT